MITRNFNLYLNAGHNVPLVINANQYDQGEQWVFTLYKDDGTQYTPSSGAIVGIKSDGLGIINSGSVVDGKVVINETQQMTAAAGKAVFELMIDDQTHGTANFIVLVEPKPGNNADLSESDLSLIQQAIDGTSATAIAQSVADWMDDNLTPTTPVVDASLTVSGAAADAAVTGALIRSGGSGLTNEAKQALLACFEHVAWIDEDGQDYYDALEAALYPPANLVSISAVYTQSGTVYDTDTLDSLKSDLVVTAHYDDYSTETVTSYTLSGTLEEGTSTVTVAYGGKTTTFDVVVTLLERWVYRFNDSILSSSSKDFGFTGTADYGTGVHGNAYHKANNVGAIYKNGLSTSETPKLDGDFTVCFWMKTVTAKAYPFMAQYYEGGSQISSLKPSPMLTGWTKGSESNVNLKYAGLSLFIENSILNIRIFAKDLASGVFAKTYYPSSFNIYDWHHYAITRSGTTMRVFIDGGVLFEFEYSNELYFPSQLSIGQGFNENSTDPTGLSSGTIATEIYVDDLLVDDSNCMFTEAFDPTDVII